MIFAELRGKLGTDGSRISDRLEDLFTSTVFGLLRYIPPREGLIPVLGMVRRAHLMGEGISIERQKEWLPLAEVRSFEIDFWPEIGARAEPDLLVRLCNGVGTTLHTVVIEVKLWSSKSGQGAAKTGLYEEEGSTGGLLADQDQLVKYWCRLQSRNSEGILTILYLTPHPSPPQKDLRESMELCPSMRLGWLSWSDVWLALNNVAPLSRSLVANDILQLLSHKGLAYFQRFAVRVVPVVLGSGQFWHPNSWFSSTDSRLPQVPTGFWRDT